MAFMGFTHPQITYATSDHWLMLLKSHRDDACQHQIKNNLISWSKPRFLYHSNNGQKVWSSWKHQRMVKNPQKLTTEWGLSAKTMTHWALKLHSVSPLFLQCFSFTSCFELITMCVCCCETILVWSSLFSHSNHVYGWFMTHNLLIQAQPWMFLKDHAQYHCYMFFWGCSWSNNGLEGTGIHRSWIGFERSNLYWALKLFFFWMLNVFII